ncbi:ATP-binding protein [Oxalobacteraceae bacterium OTU3CAMAD1]|nr:ATP-binding protein [Oxalobacteraceae bacterium OTU3CAMAD1]
MPVIDTRRSAAASDAAADAVLMRGRGPLARLRRAWRRNIFLRLGCGIFFALAVSTAIYTTYVMQTLRAEAEQNLRERAERWTAVLSRALARPLFDINSAAVSSVVDASGATPEVLVLRVLAPNGAEIASYVSPLREPVAAIHLRRDISFNDARQSYELGHIELAFSRQKMDEDLRRRIFDTVAANLLLVLGIGLSIFVVGRRAARPFSDIQASLEKLTRGETDIKLSGIGREDQVGRMSEAVLRFRDTLTRLRDAERELRDLNADLEMRISERTRELTESMLIAEESEAKLQTIVDTALDAVVRMNPEGCIVGWNTQAERIFGWSRDEALGRELDQTIIPPRFRYDHHRGMRRHLSGGGGGVLDTRIEVFALRRNGEEFPIELSITKVSTDTQGGYEFCAFIRDISIRREREQKLVTANVMAEAANIAKSEFLANMSHEIRTPMSAVLGMAYLALRTEMTPKQHDYISKIHMAALSLLGIINDILDFSKIEAGRLELESIPFLLDDVLAHVSSVTAQRALDKQLDYVIDVAPDVPRYLVGDPLRLGQVLINLVNNAVKFTPAGSLELRCALASGAAGAADGKAKLCFSVRDTGIGMTPQQKGKLFRSFIQADGSTTRQYGGTGLGLSISQQLVRLMGGNIDVESQVDHGSTFRFEVEFAVSDAAALAVRAAVYEGPVAELKLDASPRRTARVLLAEDSADNQDVTRELLALQGLDVEVVGDGQLAVERLLAAGPHAYDLVLMDLGMPLLDGYEATQQLRKDGRFNELPVIAVTSHALADVRARCLANGMQDYVTKPIDPQRLYRVLSRWLGMSMKVVPPLPPRAEVQDVSEEDARRAIAELRVLLAEFSGESLDYFESVRASLATILSPQTMGRLKHHMEQYEFEAAGKLLAAVADEDE